MACTQKYKIENFDRVSRNAEMLSFALNAVLRQEVIWSAWRGQEKEPGRYRVGVCGNASPIAIVTYRYPGQKDHTSVYEFESYHAYIRRERNYTMQVDPILKGLDEVWPKALQGMRATA